MTFSLRRKAVLRALLPFARRRASWRLLLRPATSLSEGVVANLALRSYPRRSLDSDYTVKVGWACEKAGTQTPSLRWVLSSMFVLLNKFCPFF